MASNRYKGGCFYTCQFLPLANTTSDYKKFIHQTRPQIVVIKMAKERFKIEHEPTFWECKVEIDEDVIIENIKHPDGRPYTTKDAMIEMVNFWVNGRERLNINQGDYKKTFLQQLGRQIMYIICEYNYNVVGIRDWFDDKEGWFAMDGSNGITINVTDDFEFLHSDFQIKALSAFPKSTTSNS